MCWCHCFQTPKEKKPLVVPHSSEIIIERVAVQDDAVQEEPVQHRIKIKDKIIVDTFYNIDLD